MLSLDLQPGLGASTSVLFTCHSSDFRGRVRDRGIGIGLALHF